VEKFGVVLGQGFDLRMNNLTLVLAERVVLAVVVRSKNGLVLAKGVLGAHQAAI